MIDPDLRRRWRFFLNHAGYATPPGRAACALALARAERDAEAAGLSFRWEDDPDGRTDDNLCSCGCGAEIGTCEGCVVDGPDGEHLASLWAVWDASDDYRRVIEAELASEALASLWEGAARAVPSL